METEGYIPLVAGGTWLGTMHWLGAVCSSGCNGHIGSFHKIGTEPRAKASWLRVGESSEELVAHC